jgi:signal transduction histidine kinase
MERHGKYPDPSVIAGREIAFVCDEAGKIVTASDGIAATLGLQVEAIVGQALADLAVEQEEGEVRDALEEARRRGHASFSSHLRTALGPPLEAAIVAWNVASDPASVTLCLLELAGRVPADEKVRVLADTQRAIATVLALALEEIPLDALLARTLDLILSIPWLSIERKGAIFLVENDPGTLVMKACRGLGGSLLADCARVGFGECLCGQAAMHGTTIYAADVDARHTTRYAGILPHGHYCVPIRKDDEVLGVINTYLSPGHDRSEIEIEFLTAVANTLAGVLVRRRAVAERHRAEDASRRKSELLALVSHELLTPVTAVMLSCERLQRDRDAPLAPRHAAIVLRMQAALARLASTIRLLLEHARLEAGRPVVRRAPLDLGALAAAVVAEVRPFAEQKDLAVRLEVASPLPALRSDARLLRIVLTNLVSNAVKFTEVGSVTVRVQHRDGAHRIAVEDTGPGIPPAEQSRIFVAFEPLGALANKSVPGMGLGLSLARRLALALGGRLDLESPGRSGSTFVVTLPAPAEAEAAAGLH